MRTATRGRATSAVIAIALATGLHAVAATAEAGREHRWLDEPTAPPASQTATHGPTADATSSDPPASPSPTGTPTPEPGETPTPTPTPVPTGSTAPTSTPTPTPTPTSTSTPTPTSTAPTPVPTATESLVPTTGGGVLTVTAPAQVGPQVEDDGILRIPVLGITVSDTRGTGGFTATALASTVLADGTSPVQVPALTWTTTAVLDADGVPVPEVAGPGGALFAGAVIAQGDATGRALRIDGIITIDASDLAPGDYAFSLSLSAT